MDNTNKFTQKADNYAKSRPAYSSQMIDYLTSCFLPPSNYTVADIGSGTGILTKQLLTCGYKVFAVEPNENMRTFAEKELSDCKNFISINATAENTTLENNCVDIITVAQAFHWFDAGQFKTECTRILKPNGKIFLIWNKRDEKAPINIELFEVCKKYCPEFTGFSGGTQNSDDKIKRFFDGKYQIMTFSNPLLMNKQSFIDRALSSSYSLNPDDKNFAEYLTALNSLFDKYAQNGFVDVANTTQMYFNI